MKNFIFTLSAIVLFFSCNSEKQTNILLIDLADGLKSANLSIKSLNDISSGYELIPLETSDSCLLSDIIIQHVTDNSIWMLNWQPSGSVIYRFDKTNGSMLSKFDRKGEGPEEYNSIMDWIIDDKEQIIYIYDLGKKKIIKYNFDGVYLESINNDFIGSFALLDENHFLVSYSPLIEKSFSLGIYDKQWNMIHQFSPKTNTVNNKTGMIHFDGIEYCNDKYYFRKAFNDTIYQIENQEVKPCLIISKGNFKMPVDLAIAVSKEKERSQYIDGASGYIASDYYFSQFYYQRAIYQSIWDLKTTSLIYQKILREQDDEPVLGYPFVIKDKTIFVVPKFVSDGKLYCEVLAEQIRKIMPDVKEDDNPAIIAIKLNNK